MIETPAPLISANTLQGSPDVVIFDCRFSLADFGKGREDYLAAHIPGARHLHMEEDLAGARTGSNGRHPLPSREQFQTLLQTNGVTNGTLIVCYDNNRLAGAARAWWLLKFFGLSNVQVLDGGFTAWREAEYEIASGPAEPVPPSDIVLAPGGATMLASLTQTVRASAHSDAVIIDSREAERYRGEAEPIDPVAGRIPGALNLPWQSVTDERGYAQPTTAQQERWRNISLDTSPIVYCGSGITASVNLLSLTIAGLTPGRLYPGSFSEWCAQPDLPVAHDR